MGAFMKEDDIYIGSLLELFNLRFGDAQDEQEFSGGVTEMAAIQHQFHVFQPKRTFAESAELLGLGGPFNNRVKNRWFDLLRSLPNLASDKAGETGDQRIVNALIANLEGKRPLPCFMKAHDARDKKGYGPIVVVLEKDMPIFYIENTYLTISLPMKPKKPGKPAKPKKK
jgi:hypothetical protein